MNRQEIKICVIALALIAAGGAFIKFGKLRLGKPGLVIESGTLTNEVGEVVRSERVRFPAAAEFRSADGPISKWEISVLPTDTIFGRRLYWTDDGFRAQMSAVQMKTDRTSIHRPQICVTGQGWKIEKSEIIQIPIAKPLAYNLAATALRLKTDVVDKDGKTHTIAGLYVYWFVSENRLASSHPEAIWHITKDLALRGTLYPWSYVSCFASCQPGGEDVILARMKRLIAATTPEFQLTPAAAKQSASLPNSVDLN